jgi:hypothetical protein
MSLTDLKYAKLEVAKLKEENAKLREALDRIARPIWWMQQDAKRDGCQINGAMAVVLADSGNYLRGIAEKALNPPNPPAPSKR